MKQVSASILSANWLKLGEELKRAEEAGCDCIHVDITDGHFVSNLTMGMDITRAVCNFTGLRTDVHLMIEEPERFIDEFAAAGADAITVHLETVTHVHAILSQIRMHGVKAGVAINPTTSLTLLDDVLPFCDQVLIMSVNPGFGGQSFIPTALGRIERLRSVIASRDLRCDIQVDGGIKASNIGKVVAAGASMIVCGSAIFSDDMSVADAVLALRQGIEG